MASITTEGLVAVAPKAKPAWTAAFSEHWPRIADIAGLATPLRLTHFLAQVLHESDGLTVFEEALLYSARRLTQVWPSRFPTLASTKGFAGDPERLANKVYGGRMGNREPGDGWRFRGRGPIQVTGRHMYRLVGLTVGVDLEAEPDRLLEPAFGWLSAAAVWAIKRANAPADRDDLAAVTRLINGGTHGLPQRARHLGRLKALVLP